MRKTKQKVRFVEHRNLFQPDLLLHFSCVMENMGTFKCVFSNEVGSDETAGKVTIKPVRTRYMENLLDNRFCRQKTHFFVKNVNAFLIFYDI